MEGHEERDRFVQRASRVRPRLPATTEAFNALVAEVFTFNLRARGFKKNRLVWHRPGGEVWPVIDIQRGHADSDLLTFTSNWALHVPGFLALVRGGTKEPVNSYDGPLGGRMGEFRPGPGDTWWAVGLGELRRYLPPEDVADVKGEIQELLLDHVLPFVEQFKTIQSVIEYLSSLGDVVTDRRPGARLARGDRLKGVVATLSRLTSK